MFRGHFNDLNKDRMVFQNYLMVKNVRIPAWNGETRGIDPQALFDAGKILSKHRIRDFFHLEQTLSQSETALDLAEFRLRKAEKNRRELGFIQSDIRSYLEAKAYMPTSKVLAERPASLGIEAYRLRFIDASDRLQARGIDPSDFDKQTSLYEQADRDYEQLLKDYEQVKATVAELKEAKRVCLIMSEAVRLPLEQATDEGKKGGSSSFGSAFAERGEQNRKPLQALQREGKQEDPGELPIEEARRRRQERMRQAPERSVSRSKENMLL